MSTQNVQALLCKKFDQKHIKASLKHFALAREKYLVEDWAGVALNAGKFIESTIKSLLVFCSLAIPNARDFKVGQAVNQLQQTDKKLFPETVRIVIPKACVLVYEIVNNRGGRHDASDIDVNAMDTSVVMPTISWILAEMVRFSSDTNNTKQAAAHVESITKRAYPYFENIDGRTYINAKKISVQALAFLLLYAEYPKRVGRQELVDAVIRHGVKTAAATTAVHRLQSFIDDNGGWKLRATGREKAEEILKQL